MRHDRDFEVIYSDQASGFIKGLAYANPRYFVTPRAGVTSVRIVGDWPEVKAAYQSIGVPVHKAELTEVCQDAAGAQDGSAPRRVAKAIAEQFPVNAGANIPDDWKGLHWTKRVSMAKTLGAEGELNAAKADEFIEAVVTRRAAGAQDGSAGEA